MTETEKAALDAIVKLLREIDDAGQLAAEALVELEIERGVIAEAAERMKVDLDGLGRQQAASSAAFADLTTKVEALLKPSPPDDGGGDDDEDGGEPEPPSDVLFEWRDLTAPVELPAGAARDATYIYGVVKTDPPDGKYRKLFGADASEGRYAGLCVGINKNGQFEAWVDDGAGIRQVLLGLTPRKRRFFAVRIASDALTAWVDDKVAAVTLPDGRKPCDGVAAAGKGVWNHVFVDPAFPGVTLPLLRVDRTLPTDAEVRVDRSLLADLVDPEPDVPPAPGPDPTPIGEYHVFPTMTASEVAAAIGKRSVNETIAFAPGTYRGLATIIPKDGQTLLFGDGVDPSKCVLDGGGVARPAISGEARGVVLRGGTIRGYAGSGSPGHLNPLPGGTKKFGAIDGQAAVRPTNNMGRGRAADWTLDHMRLTANYCEGVNWCRNMLVVDSEFDNNGSCGGGGFDGGWTVLRSQIHDNCRWHYSAHDHAGGLKWQAGYATQHPAYAAARVLECLIWGNWGRGIWYDYNMIAGEVARCSIWQNTHAGFEMEVAAHIDFHHNQVGDNLRSAGTGLHIQEIMVKNSKMSKVRRNLVVCARRHPLWMVQHNRGATPTYPTGDRHVGFSTSHDNLFEENVFLIMHGGARFELQHTMTTVGNPDPGGTAILYPAGGPLDGGLPVEEFNWVPRPGPGNPLRTVSRRNTYRAAAGISVPARPWPDADAKVLGGAEGFVPDWTKLPTWDLPPGFTS